jgi:cob(I)alamin adenosyltransferase
MVFLNRIYTKSGDQGQTGLGDGSRVAKDCPRVTAYGDVDELNSVLGLAVASGWSVEKDLLTRIQNDLFDVGADLCVPPQPGVDDSKMLRVTEGQVEALEQAIDRLNDRLQPLTSFILPGGTTAAGWLHVARTVCRRAERGVVTLMRTDPVNPQAMIYLNRLSDLLFVLARVANDDGQSDVLWIPGKNR